MHKIPCMHEEMWFSYQKFRWFLPACGIVLRGSLAGSWESNGEVLGKCGNGDLLCVWMYLSIKDWIGTELVQLIYHRLSGSWAIWSSFLISDSLKKVNGTLLTNGPVTNVSCDRSSYPADPQGLDSGSGTRGLGPVEMELGTLGSPPCRRFIEWDCRIALKTIVLGIRFTTFGWVRNHPTYFFWLSCLHQVEFPDEDVAEGRVSGTVTLHLPKLENVKSVVNSYLETVWVFSVFCLFFIPYTLPLP